MRISLWNRLKRLLGLPYKVTCDHTISASEMMALRAHIDEAKNDPDYAVVGLYADISDSKPTCVGWESE